MLKKHTKKNNINIGRRISKARPDLIYIGQNYCNIKIDNAKMKVLNSIKIVMVLKQVKSLLEQHSME